MKVSKANIILGLIGRTFTFQDEVTPVQLYEGFVSPYFLICVWSPSFQKLIEIVERNVNKLS